MLADQGQSDTPLLVALAGAVERRADDFGDMSAVSSGELSSMAWAFAAVNQRNAVIFVALGIAAERRLGDFSPQNLSSTAWAFATVTQLEVPLCSALARAVWRRLGDFNA